MQSLASGSQQEARLQYCLCLSVVDQERKLAHVCSSVQLDQELEGCGGHRAVEMEGQRAELPPRLRWGSFIIKPFLSLHCVAGC